jgi:hypothetical protein
MNTTFPPGDVLAILTRHHAQLEVLFDDVFDAADPEERGWAVQKAADELAGLMAAEEQVLHAELPVGDAVRRRAAQHHAMLRERCASLLALAPVDEQVEACARRLHETLAAHHRFEQDELFPTLAERVHPTRRAALGTALAVCMVRLHAAGAPRRALQMRGAGAEGPQAAA